MSVLGTIDRSWWRVGADWEAAQRQIAARLDTGLHSCVLQQAGTGQLITNIALLRQAAVDGLDVAVCSSSSSVHSTALVQPQTAGVAVAAATPGHATEAVTRAVKELYEQYPYPPPQGPEASRLVNTKDSLPYMNSFFWGGTRELGAGAVFRVRSVQCWHTPLTASINQTVTA